MRKLYQFVSISLVIGLTLSIIFSYINAGGEYYPISPVTTLGKLYYSHLSETNCNAHRHLLVAFNWCIILLSKLFFSHRLEYHT